MDSNEDTSTTPPTKTLWVRKKTPRAKEPLPLGRILSKDWLRTTSVSLQSAYFAGDLRNSLLDLRDCAKASKKKNLPIRSLRLMLQTALEGVVSVDFNLGLGAGATTAAVEFMDFQIPEAELKDAIATCVKQWASSALEIWAQANDFGKLAIRVRKAVSTEHISISARTCSLKGDQPGDLNFDLVARLIAEQLSSQSLFEAMGPCEIVLSGDRGARIELMSLPRRPLNEAGGKNPFSMVARIHVSTAPYTDAVFLSLSAAKRVWADKMPDGKNTGRQATAYVFAPDGRRIPVGMKVEKVLDKWTWVFEDEYAALVVDSGDTLPSTVQDALTVGTYAQGKWWVGIPQLTRLYRRVDQHSVMECDEVTLLDTCLPMLAGMVSEDASFCTPRRLTLNKQPQSTMLKLDDVGAAGIALYENADITEDAEFGDPDEDEVFADADADADADSDGDKNGGDPRQLSLIEDAPADSVFAKGRSAIANFRSQCVSVLNASNNGSRSTLWVIGGTQQEQDIVSKTAEVLFGDAVTVKTDPLPADVHGMRAEMPGADAKVRQRFGLRVQAWKNSGLPQAIAAHTGPKFVLICAAKERGYKPEDSVNRRAAIHAICEFANASIHHLLPMEDANSPARKARAQQAFVHRCQSAMMDVMLAHSGYVIGAASFVTSQMGSAFPPKYVYGIQAIRTRSQRYSGETPVSMAIYSRLSLSNNTTEISFGYRDSTGPHRSDWMKLAAGLIWLGRQRTIVSDDDWLRTEFVPFTIAVLFEAQKEDPNALVFVDWGTVKGLWKDLRDENLQADSNPQIGDIVLKDAFSTMSFVRIRYGKDAQIPLRSRSRSVYEIKTEGGELYTDDYAVTLKQLVEVAADKKVVGRAHFIGVMSPRKTFQLKRGKSCYRFMPRMSGKGIFTRESLPPLDKDGSVPSSTDLTVFHAPPGVDTAAIASVAMGLRVGYAHYNDWTVLPAPLFFARKIDDYIIKYPDSESEREVDEAPATGDLASDTDTLTAPEAEAEAEIGDDVSAPSRKLELATRQILDEVIGAPSSGTADDLALGSDGVAGDHAAENSVDAAVPIKPAIDWKTFDETLEACIKSANADRDVPAYKDAETCSMVLNCIKTIDFHKQPKFFEDQKARRIFNAMIRNDIKVTVDVPYFVKLKGLLGSYRPEMKTTIRQTWKTFQREGHVAPGNVRPPFNEFFDWVAQQLRHPHGLLLSSERSLYPGEFMLPQVDELVKEVCKRKQIDTPIDRRIERGRANMRVDLSEVTKALLEEDNDEAIAWLVFSSAQAPGQGFATTVLPEIVSIPGPRTLAALLYAMQCHSALGHMMLEFNKSAGRLSIQHARAYVPKDVAANSDSASSDTCEDGRHVPDSMSDSKAVLHITHSSSQSLIVDSHGSGEATSGPRDLFMKAQDNAILLLQGLTLDSLDVPAILFEVRTLLDRMESLHSSHQATASLDAAWASLLARATFLLAEIHSMDEEQQVPRYRLTSHQHGELQLLEVQLVTLGATVETAGESYHAYQLALAMPQSTRTEQKLRAAEITGTSIPLDDALAKVDRTLATCEFLVLDNGDSGGPTPGAKEPTNTPDFPPTLAPSFPDVIQDVIQAVTQDVPAAQTVAEPIAAASSPAPAGISREAMERIGAPHQTAPAPGVVGVIDAAVLELPSKPLTAATALRHGKAKLAVSPAHPDALPTTPVPDSAQAATETATEDVHALPTSLTKAATPVARQSPVTFVPIPIPLTHSDFDAAGLTAGERMTDVAYGHLKTLIANRNYGLAEIYNAAMKLTFQDSVTGDHSIILASLISTLETIDCGFTVDVALSTAFKGRLQDDPATAGINATTVCRDVGIFGAGIVSMIFSGSSNGAHDDSFWTVLGPIRQPLTRLPAVSELIDHIVSMKTKGITATREKLSALQIGDKLAIEAQIDRERNRAAQWSKDRALHGFNHRGFERMHEYLFTHKHPIGQCVAHIASGDFKAAAAALAACQSKFRKASATVTDAFKAVGEMSKPDGSLAGHAVQNIAATEKFIRDTLNLHEVGKLAQTAVVNHDMEQLKILHDKLQSARDELAKWAPPHPLDQIYVESAGLVLDSVLRLFGEAPPPACVPASSQKLLIQVPMDRSLMPSMFGQDALCSGSEVMDKIEDVFGDDSGATESDVAGIDELLATARREHLAAGRFLPAQRIDGLLQARSGHKPTQSISALFQKQKANLSQRLQDARQRVTHAMALSALDQKEANNLLRIIEGIHISNNVEKSSIGHTECASQNYPDFPHAAAMLQNHVLKVLDARLSAAKDKLRQDITEYETSNPDVSPRDTKRIRKMLESETPASIRTAHDALAYLREGKKLPLNIFDGHMIAPKEFIAFLDQFKSIRGHATLLDSLLHELQAEAHERTPQLIRSLDENGRVEAIEFINSWKSLYTVSDVEKIAGTAGNFFAGLGIGAPRYMPETTHRPIARVEFPDKAFAGLTNAGCFIPPSLGSESQLVRGYVIPGANSENAVNALIQDVSVPTFILSRSTLTLEKRASLSGNAPVLLVDDNLVAYMALHADERARRMMEIATLTFHTHPYSAEGTFVSREMFFGRRRELHSLREVKNLAILYGGRRLGKSSLLAQIEREQNELAGGMAIYIAMDDYAGGDHMLFAWRKLYNALVSKGVLAGMTTPSARWEPIRDWVQAQLTAADRDLRSCYLLLDETDNLMAHEIDLSVGGTGFVRSLQQMAENVQSQFKLRYVIAGLHNLARFTSESNAALGKAEIIALEPYSSEDDIMRGVQLITKPLAALGFFFGQGFEDLPLQILSVCNNFPAFIQIYCRKLLEHLYNKRGTREAFAYITASDLEAVERDHDLLHDLQEKFSLTLKLDRRYRAIALILADSYYSQIEAGKNDDGLSVDDIRDFCEVEVPKHFEGLSRGVHDGLLDEMRKLNVLEKNGSRYRLRNPSIAMLIGDRESIRSQMEDLSKMPSERARNHGDRRIRLGVPGKEFATGAPIFPMPVAWTHAQLETIDGNLLIVGGNNLSGIQEVIVRGEWQIGHNDLYSAHNLPAPQVSAHIARLRKQATTYTKSPLVNQTHLTKNNKLFLACTPNSWRAAEIPQYAALATKAKSSQVRLALIAHTDKLYEVAKAMRMASAQPGGVDKSADWSVASVPPWSADAVRFCLQDNVSVAENQGAVDAILTASCGFGREIQAICSGTLTVAKALELPAKAAASLAPDLETFYDRVGWPSDIDVDRRRRMQQFMSVADGEIRSSADVDQYLEECGLDSFDLLFLHWMGLMQQHDNVWRVPELYLNLLH
jgi:hypothetical protein